MDGGQDPRPRDEGDCGEHYAGCHIDRGAASAIAEYIRLNSSLRRLDLGRCHVTSEACHLLAAALLQNRSINVLDFTGAEVSEEGQEVLMRTKEGEIDVVGFHQEFYA